MAYHWTDVNEYCDPEPGSTCAIPERIVTVSWEAPRTKGTEVRLYGVTKCFGADARGAVIDGYCLREHTTLPSSTLTLLASAPASEGTITVWMRPSEVLAATDRDVAVHSLVLAASDASGARSIFAIVGTAEYCQSAEVSCPGDEPNPAAWPTVSRNGVTMTADAQDSSAGLGFYVTVSGLDPGAKVRLSTVGTYNLGWACEETEPTSELGIAGAGSTGGTATDRAEAVANASGVAILRLDLAPVTPASCPPGSKLPLFAASGNWSGLTIVDLDRGLIVRPPRTGWTI